MRETQVQSLGGEDPLEKEMATHSSTLAWKIPRMEERGRLQSMGSQRVGHNWATSLSLSYQPYFLPILTQEELSYFMSKVASLPWYLHPSLHWPWKRKAQRVDEWLWLPGVGGGENEVWLLVRRSCFWGWWVVLELYSDDSFIII